MSTQALSNSPSAVVAELRHPRLGPVFARWQACGLRLALPLAVALGLLSFMGCGSGPKFSDLRLDAQPDEYRSTTWTVESTVDIQKLPKGLRCIVSANPDAQSPAYGGLMLPASDAKKWRFDLVFREPEAIWVVYVDAYNAQKKRVARWKSDSRQKLPREKASYVFTPQQSSGIFETVDSTGDGPIDNIHVFVRVKPGGRGIFDVSGIGLER